MSTKAHDFYLSGVRDKWLKDKRGKDWFFL